MKLTPVSSWKDDRVWQDISPIPIINFPSNNFGNYFWIGVKENKYLSDGAQVATSPPWKGESWYESNRKIDKCLIYGYNDRANFGKWYDFGCTNTYASVCEPNL